MVKMKKKKKIHVSFIFWGGGSWVSPKISPTKHFSHQKSLIFLFQPNIALVYLGGVYILHTPCAKNILCV